MTTGKAIFFKVLFLLYFLLWGNTGFAQLTIEWDRTFGGSAWEELNGSVLTNDNGYLFCGTTFSNISFDVSEPNRGIGDFWIIKTDTAGTKLWDRRYGGNGWDRLWAVINTSDGGYLLGGESDSNAGDGNDEKSEDSMGGLDYWIVKIDDQGNYEWDETIGGTGQDTLFGLAETNDGYILAGFSGSQPSGDKTAPNYGNADYWIVKIDKNDRTVLWDKTFGGNARDQLFSMKMAHDNGIILGGSSSSDPTLTASSGGNKLSPFYGLNDMWLVKLDQNGDLQWEQTYGGDGEETIQNILLTSDGGYLLTGQSSSTPDPSTTKLSPNFGHWDYYVVKVDGQGNLEWENTFGGEGTDLAYSAIENGIGNYLICGVSGSMPGSGGGNKTSPLIGNTANDFWMVYLTPDGQEVIWDMSFGGNSIDSPPNLHLAHNGGYIFGGHSSSNSSPTKSENSKGLNDFYIVKTTCPIFLEVDDIINTCADEVINLDVTIEQCPNCEYIWNDGYQGPNRTLPNDKLTQEYTVTAIHEDGCTISDNFVVELAPIPERFVLDKFPISCFGESDAAISVMGVEGGTPPFRYKMNGAKFTEPTDFFELGPGDYYLSVIDTNECSQDTMISIIQPEEPLVLLPDDFTLDWGDSVQIQALVNPAVKRFEWSLNDFLSCDDCLEPYVSPLQTSSIRITVEDENGCENSDDLTIKVVKNLAVYVPNAFSPNGDGQNDYISIYGNKTVRNIKTFKIFDRWGQLMFENNDFPPNVENAGWDGKFNGKFRKPGVFVYLAEVEFADGSTESIKGGFHLIR